MGGGGSEGRERKGMRKKKKDGRIKDIFRILYLFF